METEDTQVNGKEHEYVTYGALEASTSLVVNMSAAISDSILPQENPPSSVVHQSQQGLSSDGTLTKVQHGSNSSDYALQNSSTSATTPFTGRRFSAVNINKKFLEKNSSTGSSVAGHLAGFGANKTGSATSAYSQTTMRPGVQSTISHSRLVTTKLTQSLTATSPTQGWSRPSSVAPSPLHIPTQSNSTFGNSSSQNDSQIMQSNKTAQLQTRGSLRAKGESSDVSIRPVWRSLPGSTLKTNSDSQHDFPTAAEAAKASLVKSNELRLPADSTSAQKRAMLETAAAFRGAHLDPNAHHWDEMEEDDNDFLENVIEFGDGTQYKVHVEDDIPYQSSTVDTFSEGCRLNDDRLSDIPVSKEERLPDDFDRSWPRTKTTVSLSSKESDKGSVNKSLNSFSNPRIHTNELTHSRVLFNERSNRMEPYASGGSAWQGSSATQGRGLQSNVQVLQKTDRLPSNGIQEDDYISEHTNSVVEDRARASLKELVANTTTVNYPEDAVPTLLHSFSSDNLTKTKEVNILPLHISSISPPPTQVTTSHKTLLSADIPESPSLPDSATSDPPRSFSSLSSRTIMTSSMSGRSTNENLQNGPDSADVERLRKEYLHISAERAKQRRQQEEEERQKAQERARKKAAELVTKMSTVPPRIEEPVVRENDASVKVAKSNRTNDSELEQLEISDTIEGTVTSVTTSASFEPGDIESPHLSGSLHPTSRRDRTSYNAMRNASAGNTASSQHLVLFEDTKDGDSWRKAGVFLLTGANGNETLEFETEPPLPTSNLELHCFDVRPGEDVQILDFSDIDKLLPKDDIDSTMPINVATRFKPSRSVARDFFGDNSDIAPAQSVKSGDFEQVKRNGPIVANTDMSEDLETANKISENGEYDDTNGGCILSDRRQVSQMKDVVVATESGSTPLSGLSSQIPASLKSPRVTTMYREAPMAALTDTMSRIKGALDGMQTGSAVEGSSDAADGSDPRQQLVNKSSRGGVWLPPALRNVHASQYRESFVTHPEPLFSLPSFSHDIVIRLPKRSKKLIPLLKRQFSLWRPGCYNDLEIYSSNTFVDGRICDYILLNDILFRKPEITKGGKLRYRVVVPKSSISLCGATVNQLPMENRRPKVNIPNGYTVGAFGRPKVDDNLNWRGSQSTQLNTMEQDNAVLGIQSKLNVTSRSPPPEPFSGSTIVLSLESKSESQARTKAKASQRSVAADVAFYRDTRTPSGTSSSILHGVKFTVVSELDGTSEDSVAQPKLASNWENGTRRGDSGEDEGPRIANGLLGTSKQTDNSTSSNISSSYLGLHILPSGPSNTMPSTKIDTRTVEEPIDLKRVSTAKTSLSTWGQSPLAFHVEGSTADPPNSDLLKAVWSQTSDKERLPTVNSLKGIADDLSGVPFTLHEVKSDDGGTPPPVIQETASAQPSRMSASEVARAFQVVPAGPTEGSSTSLAVPFSPSSSNTQSLPLSGSGVISPSVSTGLRPPYGGYTSPMMSHSPSPTLLFAQQHGLNPIPAVPSPQYVQPVWVPLPGSVPQQSVQLMQSHNSPQYNHSYYTFPPAIGQTVYPAMQHTARYYSNNVHSRVPLVSPSQTAMTSQSHPHQSSYTTSPQGATTSNQTFSPVNIGRGFVPLRTSYENHSPISPPPPRQSITNTFPAQPSVPRPTW